MIHIRRAGPLDASAMAELLNQIITKGGTTAYTSLFTSEMIRSKLSTPDAIWHLAEAEDGAVLGFQWIEPHPDLDADSTDIATFVKIGVTGLGVGSALFQKTLSVARTNGYRFVNAIIRADNDSGLAYYQSRGFENYRRLTNQTLDDGQVVDKIWKRYDLTQ